MDLSSFNSSPVDTGVATPNLTQLGINTAEVILGQIRSKINAKGRGDNPDLVSPELRKQNASKITISRGPTNHTKRPDNIRLVDIINDQFNNIDQGKLKSVSRLGGITYGRTTEVYELPRPSYNSEVKEQNVNDLLKPKLS